MLSLPWKRGSKIHYAWVILATVLVIQAMRTGIRLSFSVFIDPLVEQYGWSRGAISFAYTLQFLSGIPVTLMAGWLGDRLGARRVVFFSTLLFTLGMVLTATATHLWQFYLYFGILVGGVGTTALIIVLPVTISYWFQQRLGMAMGLAWIGVGVGPIFLSPLFRWLIEDVGWQRSFYIMGIGAGAMMLLGAAVLRNRPQDMGLKPYGAAPAGVSADPAQSLATAAVLPFSQVRTTFGFWGLALVHFFGCIGHSVLLAHIVSIATFRGIPGLAAAGIVSLFSATSLISRFGTSLWSETRGARSTLALVLLLQTTPVLILLVAKELWVFYLFAILFGLGYGGESVGFPIFNRQFYGMRGPLTTIYAYQMALAETGMAVGGYLGGALFDWSGSYTWTIVLALVAGYAGLLVALTLPRYRRQIKPIEQA